MSELQKLQDAACSDGNCVFKITPEMRKGMRTNGGCCCLKDMTYGIGHHKTHGVMELSRIASDAEAALKARDAEIAALKQQVQELIGANNRLYDAVLKDSCPWCGLNNKSNVKREMEARE